MGFPSFRIFDCLIDLLYLYFIYVFVTTSFGGFKTEIVTFVRIVPARDSSVPDRAIVYFSQDSHFFLFLKIFDFTTKRTKSFNRLLPKYDTFWFRSICLKILNLYILYCIGLLYNPIHQHITSTSWVPVKSDSNGIDGCKKIGVFNT